MSSSSSLSVWLRVRSERDGKPSKPRIFISYRRDDTRFFSSRIYDRMVAHFGKEKVFRDVDSIAPGRPWDEAIDDAIGSCNVFVVLIGGGWLTATDDQGRVRLEDPDDRHRREIEAAIERRIMVFPVLMEDMEMPGPDQLPDTMRELQKIQGRRITDDAFDYGTNELISAIEAGIGGGAPRRVPRAALIAGGLVAIAAIVAAVIALASGGGGDKSSKEATGPAQTTAAQPADTAAQIETSKGVLRVTKVSQPDKYPPNCTSDDPNCGQARAGRRFLVVTLKPVGGIGKVPRAEVLKAYVQGSNGKRTTTFEFSVDTTKAEPKVTMAFDPPTKASGFKLYYPGNDPVDLDAFLAAGGNAPSGGGTPTGKGFSAVTVGQTKDEVRAIMGQPESTQKDLGGTRECWYYDVSQGSAGHTVCFDRSGRVMQRQ